MTERFQKAYDALCEAFFEGTLAKGTCAACACGNIVAKAVGIKIDLANEKDIYSDKSIYNHPDFPSWASTRLIGIEAIGNYITSNYKFIPKPNWEKMYVSKQIFELTGYTIPEMCAIETAFENTTKISIISYYKYSEEDKLQDQYNGLCAVFDVLCKLDNVDVNYKDRLNRHPKLVIT